jgi:hypothetical protein
MPLHCASAEVLGWASAASFARGLPPQVSTPVPLCSVAEFLSLTRDAGCHGTAWFRLRDVPVTSLLPGCPDARKCRESGGWDLGEISLDVVGHDEADPEIPSTGLVEAVSFGRPNSAAVAVR